MTKYQLLKRLMKLCGYTVDDAIIVYGIVSLVQEGITKKEVDRLLNKNEKKSSKKKK